MVTIKYPLFKVAIIYREFYSWKRETTFLNGNLRKTMPTLVSFIALCDGHTQAKGQSTYQEIEFLFEMSEAHKLAVDIYYMTEIPPSLSEVRIDLLNKIYG